MSDRQRVLIHLVVLLLVCVSLAGCQSGASREVAGARCAIGMIGHPVSVTVEGSSPRGECNSLLSAAIAQQGWYLYEGDAQPTGPVICQVTLEGQVATVRDQGLTTEAGATVCSQLVAMSQANGLTGSGGAMPGIDFFSFDPALGTTLLQQQKEYLLDIIKPCPRAGCETSTIAPSLAWLDDPVATIPPALDVCFARSASQACQDAVSSLAP